MTKFVRRLHNYIAAHSDIYAKLETKLKAEKELRLSTEKGYWALVCRLREFAPDLAEHNRQGRFLPVIPNWNIWGLSDFGVSFPLKKEGVGSHSIVFSEESLNAPWTAEEIKALAEALKD